MTMAFAYSIAKILPLMLLMVQPSFGALPDEICQEAVDVSDRAFCLDFFEKHGGSGKPIEGLAQITIDETLKGGTDAVVFVGKLKVSARPEIASLLEICSQGYNNLVNEYVDVSFAFAKKDYGTVKFNEQKCPRFVEDCKKNVDEPVPLMVSVNHQMGLLAKISIATSNRL